MGCSTATMVASTNDARSRGRSDHEERHSRHAPATGGWHSTCSVRDMLSTMPPRPTEQPRRARKLSRRDCYRVSRQPPPPAERASIPVGCLDEDTRRRVCSLVAGVVCADDSMTPPERVFLRDVMIRMGLDPDTGLMPIYADQASTEIRMLPRSLLHTTLDLAITAAVADGRVVRPERAIVDAIATELGVSALDVDGRVRRALHRAHAPPPQLAAVSRRDVGRRAAVSHCDNRDRWGPA